MDHQKEERTGEPEELPLETSFHPPLEPLKLSEKLFLA